VRERGGAYIIANRKAVTDGGFFTGSDDELRRRGVDLLKGLGIDPKEVAEIKVLQQFIQRGLVNRQTRQMRAEPPRRDQRMLWATRAVNGIPVWSSRLLLTLDRQGRIAYFEMVWPRIDPKVLNDAQRLQRIGTNFRAPEVANAKPEQVGAGILHSAAIGFFNDQTAAMRVIYRANRREIGKKPVYYLTAEGRPVAMPRNIEAPPAPQRARKGKGPKPSRPQ
jgi:hypothetical protein